MKRDKFLGQDPTEKIVFVFFLKEIERRSLYLFNMKMTQI